MLTCCSALAMADGGQKVTIGGRTVEKNVTRIEFRGDNVILTYDDASTQTADMSPDCRHVGSGNPIRQCHRHKQCASPAEAGLHARQTHLQSGRTESEESVERHLRAGRQKSNREIRRTAYEDIPSTALRRCPFISGRSSLCANLQCREKLWEKPDGSRLVGWYKTLLQHR